MSDTNYAVIYDLHSHTTASDGCLTPEALVHRAVEMRVGTLAITDHDTTAAIAPAREEISRSGLALNLIPGVEISQVPIVKGDAKSISIAAASIVAKVTRDRMMKEYEEIFPGYDFASNKGYGTKAHIQALKTLGPCVIHRRSFIGNFVK